MNIDANYVRDFAGKSYIRPALESGDCGLIAVKVNAVESDLRKQGLAAHRTPLICSVLKGKKIQHENGVILDHWDGPPSGQSTTVVFYYRRAEGETPPNGDATLESPTQRAFRLTEKLRGLMKEEIAAHGGTEGFMRWVRSDEDESAA